MLSSSSTFPWRGRRGSLATHGKGGRKVKFRGFSWRKEEFREFGEGDGKKRENGEKEDEDEVEVKECDK